MKWASGDAKEYDNLDGSLNTVTTKLQGSQRLSSGKWVFGDPTLPKYLGCEIPCPVGETTITATINGDLPSFVTFVNNVLTINPVSEADLSLNETHFHEFKITYQLGTYVETQNVRFQVVRGSCNDGNLGSFPTPSVTAYTVEVGSTTSVAYPTGSLAEYTLLTTGLNYAGSVSACAATANTVIASILDYEQWLYARFLL